MSARWRKPFKEKCCFKLEKVNSSFFSGAFVVVVVVSSLFHMLSSRFPIFSTPSSYKVIGEINTVCAQNILYVHSRTQLPTHTPTIQLNSPNTFFFHLPGEVNEQWKWTFYYCVQDVLSLFETFISRSLHSFSQFRFNFHSAYNTNFSFQYFRSLYARANTFFPFLSIASFSNVHVRFVECHNFLMA